MKIIGSTIVLKLSLLFLGILALNIFLYVLITYPMPLNIFLIIAIGVTLYASYKIYTRDNLVKILSSTIVSKLTLLFFGVMTVNFFTDILGTYPMPLNIILLIVIGVPIYASHKIHAKDNLKEMPSSTGGELTSDGDPVSNKKLVTNNLAVYFLYATLAYSLLAWPILASALASADRGESGTEYIGIIVMVYIVNPSITVLIIYSIVFFLTEKSRYSPGALKKRKYALVISWGYWVVAFISIYLLIQPTLL